MSEMYEGVVFRSNERDARRTFASLTSALRFRLVRLARGVFGIYRVTGRTDVFDPPAVEQVAKRVSANVGHAVALFYDNSCCIRVGVLYSDGRRQREFGVGDEWWVPFDEHGRLDRDGPCFRVTDLRRDQEYDCSFSAIDATLEAVSIGRRVSSVLLKQAFCYEAITAIAESSDASHPPRSSGGT